MTQRLVMKSSILCFDYLILFREKIILKEKDIEMLKNEIAISYEEAKHLLIKHHGNYQKVIESFLNDFRFSSSNY